MRTNVRSCQVVLATLVVGYVGLSYASAAEIRTEVDEALRAEKSVRVCVVFNEPADAPRPEMPGRRQHVASFQQKVLKKLAGTKAEAYRKHSHLGGMAIEVDAAAIERLRKDPDVSLVYLDGVVHSSDAEGDALIQANVARSTGGYSGAGQTVAVIDTGIDYRHSALGGTCGADTFPTSRVIGGYDYVNNDADPMDDQGHGTSVAGIIGATGSNSGVAPGVKFVALKVLNSSGGGNFSAVDSALNWVIANYATYGITLVNMSLGDCTDHTDPLVSPCSGSTTATAISTLKSLGIAVFVASGNEGYRDGMAFPACVPDAISVGAVYDANLSSYTFNSACGHNCTDANPTADSIACFSSTASFLDLLAPSYQATTTARNCGTNTGFSGTSAASPYAAGAAALLRESTPSLSVAELLQRLKLTGTPIHDPQNGLNFPRINVWDAIRVGQGLGVVEFDKDIYHCSDTVGIMLTDMNATGSGSQIVVLTSSTGDSETIALIETPAGSGQFNGSVPTGVGSPTTNDGVIQAVDGGTLTVTYQDVNNGSGNPATVQDTASFTGNMIYVMPTGDDANDGLSWQTAKRTVTGGLAAAVSGGQVWVAGGTYVECITLKAGVGLYGGFVGSETSLSQRNWQTNVTILDGNQAGSVVTSPSGATATTRIDGFTIRNGIGTVSGSSRYGGGIYCSNSSPSICNNTITGNSAYSGGGIYCDYSTPSITNNAIIGNSANGYYGVGGGIYCSYSSPLISNNTIAANGAIYSGGGIYCSSISSPSSSPLIYNNRITGNSAKSGGGIICGYSSSPMITNNTITGNNASTSGGGVYCSDSSSPSITNNTITRNNSVSSVGSGIYCSGASPVISNNIVAFNSSGLYKSGGTPVLRNNCVYNPAGANYSGLSAGTGDIFADPQLLATDCGEVHLMASSPCIDAGNDAAVQTGWVDMDGQNRIQDTHVDIGADEFNGTTPLYMRKVVRVSLSGNDANDGSTWASAKRTVQAGIDAITAAGGGDVWVAAGTYSERVTLKMWSHVYGGFAGTESSRDQRNWLTNVTVLDGGAGGNVVTASAPGYGISTVDGFTICNGSGIYCSYSSPMITNNTITGNSAGGIHCYSSSPSITNNTITGNSAIGSGGGILCESSSFPAISNNTITGNSASNYGGGICCYSSSAVISNNIVAFNSSGLYNSYGTPALRNNCVYNPDGADYTGLSAGTGDISVDPQILAADCGEVHLMASSPCINAGNDAAVQTGWVDMDGQARIQGAHVDIGVDEFDGTTPLYTRKVVRVSLSGNDANDGSTWASAKRTVQAGIGAVTAAGGGDVWVAAGTYSERITLKLWTHVYGGFAGKENSRDQRNWVTNVTILDGAAGGSVVTASTPGSGSSTIDGFTVRNGTGTLSSGYTHGGGIYCSNSSPVITNNTITGNRAYYSGGICCYYSSPTISNNNISGNMANGYYGTGGGIYCYYSCPAIFKNTISGNKTMSSAGGGIYCVYCSPSIYNNVITGNSAYTGGGIYCGDSSLPLITNNAINGNYASSYGGGIACGYSYSIPITNNTIIGNTSVSYGGGIYTPYSSSIISNNIIAYNSSGLYNSTGTPMLRNNCVYGNTSYNYSGITDPTGTNGNISVDPLFVDRSAGIYQLAPGSPCIDAGNNTYVSAGTLTDLAGHPRFVDDLATADTGSGAPPIVDIGAYEYQTSCHTPKMDTNGDQHVDAIDFDTFSACYNGPTNKVSADCLCMDANSDQYVDAADFDTFSGCYNGPTNPPRCE